jgi:hypothetical protein
MSKSAGKQHAAKHRDIMEATFQQALLDNGIALRPPADGSRLWRWSYGGCEAVGELPVTLRAKLRHLLAHRHIADLAAQYLADGLPAREARQKAVAVVWPNGYGGGRYTERMVPPRC